MGVGNIHEKACIKMFKEDGVWSGGCKQFSLCCSSSDCSEIYVSEAVQVKCMCFNFPKHTIFGYLPHTWYEGKKNILLLLITLVVT